MGLLDGLKSLISDGPNYDPNERVDRERRRQQALSDAATARAERQRDAVERELQDATQDWLLPAVIRTFESNAVGERRFADEAAVLDQHGYRPVGQSSEGGRFRAGKFILTGGLGAVAGGLHTKGKLTVTFQRA